MTGLSPQVYTPFICRWFIGRGQNVQQLPKPAQSSQLETHGLILCRSGGRLTGRQLPHVAEQRLTLTRFLEKTAAIMRVLIVQDEKKMASFIRKALQAEGFAADVLHHGDEALAAAGTAFDVIIL